MAGSSKKRETLNGAILAEISRVASEGGYRFEPSPRCSLEARNPRDPHYDGVRQPLEADGVVFARSNDSGNTYCCGVTLEVWWRACLQILGQPPSRDAGAAERLLVDWFCPVMGHPGVSSALISRGWGYAVDLNDAIPGDLVQFWRSVDLKAPSGHSAVFLGVELDLEGRTHLKYWSSQPATDGVGCHEELVGDAWQVHVVRPTIPR